MARRYPLSGGAGGGMATGCDGTGQSFYAVDYSIPIFVTARSEYYIGFDLRSNNQAHNWDFVHIQTAAGADLVIFNNASGINTTFGNTAGGLMAINTWYQVQIYVKRHATAGMLTIKIDGVTVLNLTGLAMGSTDIGKIVLHPQQYGGVNLAMFDNLWIFNTLGTHSNGFPVGRMKVQALMPNAAGTYTDLTPSAGSNYQNVDETTANDDTDYNSGITATNKDSYNLTDLSGSIAQVHGVQVTAIVRKDDVDSKTYQTFTKSGSTETYSADIVATLAYASSTPLILTDDPNTSAQWTVTNVNALEAGVKITL